jgi:hypothetical protein
MPCTWVIAELMAGGADVFEAISTWRVRSEAEISNNKSTFFSSLLPG